MHHPSIADFEAAAFGVVDRLPETFRDLLGSVIVRVEEFATAEQLRAVGIANRWNLTGLYEGVALTERSQWDIESLPPVITLFRQPLLAEMQDTGVSFDALIRHVVIHEAGHHFGLSDADMHALEEGTAD
ncbi:metallopeptidase family protein [Erythrobacter sp. R86502]|uniref:metallopeptidase family protein n=1 Tax=Erythrobacter sp. R86502 TaxID=3093846 RepID=UPI0036D2D909